MFVVLEGLDASGKTTQAAWLAERVGAELFKYPDRTTPLGRLIDRWLKGQVTLGMWGAGHSETRPDVPIPILSEDHRHAALCLQGLLLANKVEVQPKLLRALVANHGWVVADRYTPSAVAYGGADGLDAQWLYESHDTLVKPDLYILLDVTTEIAAERRAKQGGGEHYEQNMGRLHRARANYLALAEKGPSRHNWHVVNGMLPPNDVHDIIYRLVMQNAPQSRPSKEG